MNLLLAVIGQLIIYLLLFVADPYFGTLISAVLGTIALAIWLLSFLVEMIEPSRVSSRYYQFVFTAWVSPLAALVGYIVLNGEIGWL
ncbi:hypothetical protein [Lewinella sp. IMCC34191]|uniref:hypothetical protein n=1 Tax=Lewinella sp. IMCC34191 TaxID=2259172 RepID=UPI000E2432E9|nr:hypothetical protein [Lewinella sp. IMCC34191]